MPTEIDDDSVPQEQLTKDRPFNAFRMPKTQNARAVVADVLGQVQCFERVKGLRQRQRRPVDQGIFEATITAVICDLMHRAITHPEGWVSIPLSNQYLGRASRYRAPAMNKALPDILDRLSSPEMAFVEMEKGHQGYFGPSRRTVLHAGWRLLSRIEEHGIGRNDLGQTSPQEVIILKREKAGGWDEGGQTEYGDTATTDQYRAEMRAINAWLTAADIQFDPAALPDDSPAVDDTDRHLCRYFSKGSFGCGGRLFGGFWQRLPKWQRRKGLLINGEEVATLDYAQMAPRILYGLAEQSLPAWDAYLLPGLEAHRNGIKKVLNAALFADQLLTRYPKGTRELFPARVKLAEVIEKLEQAHAPIRHLFFTGIGHKAQFVESEVLVDVLLALKNQDIVALPIHDAVVIPRSAIPQVTEVMTQVFKHHTGVDGVVSEEVV